MNIKDVLKREHDSFYIIHKEIESCLSYFNILPVSNLFYNYVNVKLKEILKYLKYHSKIKNLKLQQK